MSPSGGCESARIAATASASVTVMKTSTEDSRNRHASGDTSPHASPAITESTVPLAGRGAPASALCKRQSACSGSTTTKIGRRSP